MPEPTTTPAAATAAPTLTPATLTAGPAGAWLLAGDWTLHGLGALAQTLAQPSAQPSAQPLAHAPPRTEPAPTLLDGAGITAMDSAGAWVLQRWAGPHAAAATLRAWPARAQALMQEVQTSGKAALPQPSRHRLLQRTGRGTLAAAQQVRDFVVFIGQVAATAGGALRHPRRLRLKTVLREIQSGGFDALPIVGLTSFLLGVVVAYQGADQLKHYGANVFVVELVGYAMLREFAPLMGAIIIAGRSGSAYAAQLGTMVVAEEIDAMRTIAIDPIERLVLPKFLALAVALPLLTVFADLCGVFGGMVMARSQLGIGFVEFADRFGQVMQGSALLLGVGKALVFALIIVAVGCFQGFRTQGSADSVGRQTTQSVVQAIFLVIVADALFSVLFNVLDL